MNTTCHKHSLPELSIIDPHVHLFDLQQGDYHWLKPDNPPFWSDKKLIAKNVNEQALTLPKPLSLSGFVHIEAGFDNEQPWREIHWLEQTCTLPFRSIAYIDMLASPINFSLALSRLTQFSSVVGVRYIFDDDFIQVNSHTNVTETLLSNLQQLADNHLLFELHIAFNNIELVKLFTMLLAQSPELKVIINHCGFPDLKNTNSLDNCLGVLKHFSQQANIAVKCSGLEMNNREYTNEWQTRIIETCLDYFGENRVMLASNFPLTLFKESYADYWQRTINILKLLLEKNNQMNTDSTLEKLCNTNSQQWYQLKY